MMATSDFDNLSIAFAVITTVGWKIRALKSVNVSVALAWN